MIGVDANVLVRLLVADDIAQNRKASALLERCTSHGEPVFVALIVVVELVWTLRRLYRISKHDILNALDKLLSDTTFIVERSDDVADAIRRCRTTKSDLSDILIGIISTRAGCATIYTFDKSTARLDAFTAL